MSLFPVWGVGSFREGWGGVGSGRKGWGWE